MRKRTGGGPAVPELSQVSATVAVALADSLNPLDNPFDGDAGHNGDEVINLTSPDSLEKPEVTALDT
ncbi:unnamed protein product [Sphagnum jensenii]|uniref:Uncharacterized protein n=1 Tax=Sphagnum jensenii TaxID=128206 RepID=A0ABP0VM29_9BRYO